MNIKSNFEINLRMNRVLCLSPLPFFFGGGGHSGEYPFHLGSNRKVKLRALEPVCLSNPSTYHLFLFIDLNIYKVAVTLTALILKAVLED